MVEIDLAFTSSYIYSYRDFHVDPTILQGFCAICQLVANCHVYKLISQQKYTPLLPTKIMPFSFRDKKKTPGEKPGGQRLRHWHLPSLDAAWRRLSQEGGPKNIQKKMG